ncbi:hypothetical protein, partial [Ruminococcus sp.]|uniref:hypothetical protein n=1 Tax=Ruminococcus sp. TaxID=41978 RepID=UPI002E7A9A88
MAGNLCRKAKFIKIRSASKKSGASHSVIQRENAVLFFRTCLHKKYMWIFEHNFVAGKAKIRRRAVARQVFFTQDAAKFAEKTL